MADQKISQLTDGTSFQAGDEAVVNRSGTNYKVDPTQFGSSINVTGTVTADGLTVDSSSGITVNGPTNQDGKLNLVAYAGVQDAEARIQAARGNTSGTDSRLQFLTNNGTSLLTRVDINDNGDISFYEDTGTTPKFFWDASAERLGIGTSSPTGNLQVNDGTTLLFRIGGGDSYVGADAGSSIIFRDGTTENMRIDSSGNLLVGTTSVALGNAGFKISGATPGFARSERSGTTSQTHIAFTNGNGDVGSIGTNGSATLYNISSDVRLKENIADAEDASSLVDAIKVRQFDWKADGSHQRYGMVAQELLEVAPEAVSQGATENEMMGVDYSKLVPMLVKEIQSLRARVHALESK